MLGGRWSLLLGLELLFVWGPAHGKCVTGPLGRLPLSGRTNAAHRDVSAQDRDVKRLRDS